MFHWVDMIGSAYCQSEEMFVMKQKSCTTVEYGVSLKRVEIRCKLYHIRAELCIRNRVPITKLNHQRTLQKQVVSAFKILEAVYSFN